VANHILRDKTRFFSQQNILFTLITITVSAIKAHEFIF